MINNCYDINFIFVADKPIRYLLMKRSPSHTERGSDSQGCAAAEADKDALNFLRRHPRAL